MYEALYPISNPLTGVVRLHDPLPFAVDHGAVVSIKAEPINEGPGFEYHVTTETGSVFEFPGSYYIARRRA